MDIVVVDDNASYRELLVLAAERCRTGPVRQFPDAESALAALPAGGAGPALWLVDLHMPRMSGIELIARLRSAAPAAAAAMLSAAATPEEREASLAAGALAAIDKPLCFAAICECVERLVRTAERQLRGGGC